MYDMRQLVTRYFELVLPNGLKLDVEPPKLKSLKKIAALANQQNLDDKAIQDLAEGLSMALSKNKQNRPVASGFIIDTLNVAQIQGLLQAYFEWVAEIQNSKN